MRFIVSPAKKMGSSNDVFAWRDMPRHLDKALCLAEALRALDFSAAQALWRTGDDLSALNYRRMHTVGLTDEAALTPAAFSYEGIQYQHLAPRVMTVSELEYIQTHLRILSGLYGVLRPFDGVVPYRLEMQARLAAGGHKDLYRFWGSLLFESLCQETDTVVNLASAEYARTVVPFAQKNPALKVITCRFGTVAGDTLIQRPTALKAARGSMVRWCAERGITEAGDLRAFTACGYRFDDRRSDADTYVFVLDSPNC